MMKKPKVSVIIAVYGVGPYIEKCARSLFDQTLDDVEFVFVNDCTPDDSITVLEKVLKDYPDRQAQTKIINLEANGGVENARTTGMKAATGEYMIHCDPDDHVDTDCYATLYDEARKTASDIVVCDYYRETAGRQEYVTQHYGQTPRESIQDFYKVPFFPSLWDTLIRTSLIQSNQIYPYPGINTGEDLNVIFRAFLKADTLAYVNKAFYHYVQRPGSLTRSKDIKTLWDNNIARNIINLSQLLDYQSQLGGGKKYEHTKHYLQYSKKLMLLQCESPHWQLWYHEYKECVDSLPYFHGFSSKHKFIMRLFAKHYSLLAFYYKVMRPLGIKVI